MNQGENKEASGFGGLAALGVAALAIGCCAGLPLLAALAGSVAVGTLLGAGAGLLVLVGLAVLLVVRIRRRAACPAPKDQPVQQHRSRPQVSGRQV